MHSDFSLSVITVHFEDYSRLNFTWASIRPLLKSSEIEWIVIDGNSKAAIPSERELLVRVEQDADVYVSEPDNGIFDAMNKGIKLASGMYFLFLNAGDRLSPAFSLDSLKRKVGEPFPDMIWGNTKYQYSDDTFAVKKLRKPAWMFYGMPVCHQSVLFLTHRFSNMPYNVNYQIAADYDLLARALNSGANTLLIKDIISEYSAGGVSQSDRWLSLTEENDVRVKNYAVPSWLGFLIKVVKLGLWKLNDFSPSLNRVWRRHL